MLTYERAHELLSYDPETGHLCWKKIRRGATPPGVPISCPSHGYISLRVDYKQYLAHRVIWLMVHGSWPPAHIDHIDGNPANNRLANLREATPLQNILNSTRRKDNTSGYKGVFLERRTNKWVSRVKVGSRRVHLGSFSSPEEAHLAYCEAASKYFGEHFCDGKR